MTLPGLTKQQMVTVDRIMMEDLEVPVELMMEHAGSNLARLALLTAKEDTVFKVIVGSGNNGAGGMVAARRLSGWGHKVEVFAPRGVESFRRVPAGQFARLRSLDIPVTSGIPSSSEQEVLIDAYLGYGFVSREDEITEQVLDHMSGHDHTVCLDVPSGLNLETGEGVECFMPRATLTIAFVKEGLLKTYPNATGQLYICDIGVPMHLYRTEIGLKWDSPYSLESLAKLADIFEKNSMTKVEVIRKDGFLGWNPLPVTN